MSTCQPETLALPELQQAVLDTPTLTQLFTDIRECTEVYQVIPRYARKGHVGEAVLPLETAREQFLAGKLQALQVRYQYNGTEWWDTLLSTSAGTRLIRIQHDFTKL